MNKIIKYTFIFYKYEKNVQIYILAFSGIHHFVQ